MSEPLNDQGEEPRVVVIGPDGLPAQSVGAEDSDDSGNERGGLTDLVEEPAKVMRIGSMIRQLLEEIKAAPLDEPGRQRLASILKVSITELKTGLAPELDEELDRLIEPFSENTPTESELRIAQAQLVGWLEGLFHGIQTAIYAQQLTARAQLEQMRRALPPGSMPPGMHAEDPEQGPAENSRGGMYL
jgi:hypothetical protein